MIKYRIFLGFAILLLSGCNPELGRLPLVESDVGCLRKQLSSVDHPSFQVAANFCQQNKNDTPLPLKLHGALGLQKQAELANIAYIP